MGNAGDEILKDYFLARFSEHEWLVCSANPQAGEYPRLPAGIRSLISFRWIKTAVALKKSDGMVFGGGSLFTDAESWRACFIWFMHAFFAWVFRKKIILAFQGIGPFQTSAGSWFSRWVIARAAFISVRDTASATVDRMRIKSTECIQSFDPSILLLEANKSESRTNNVCVFIPRVSTRKVDISSLQDTLDIRILSFQPGDEKEWMLCKSLGHALNCEARRVASLFEASGMIDGVCIITQRYHGAILAIAAGIPFIAIYQQVGDKLDLLATECGCPSVSVEEFSASIIKETDWDNMRERVGESRERLIERAKCGEEALRKELLM